MKRVLVCGCRWLGDRKSILESHQYSEVNLLFAIHRKFFYDTCDTILTEWGITNPTVISGGANGADTLAIEWGEDRGYVVEKYPALWRVEGTYNPKAGIERNAIMVDRADQVIAFWDYVSRGTKDSILRTEQSGKPLHIVDIRRFKLNL